MNEQNIDKHEVEVENTGTVANAELSPVSSDKPAFTWRDADEPGRQLEQFCEMLASLGDVFALPNGKIARLCPNGGLEPFNLIGELAGFVQHRLDVTRISSNGERKFGLPQRQYSILFSSKDYQSKLPVIDHVVSAPTFTQGGKLLSPSYNPGPEGERFYLTRTKPTSIAREPKRIREFLGAMSFKSLADATNTVAFGLTVMLRHRFPGGKPFVPVSANRSQAGKDTAIDFACGLTQKEETSYGNQDWAIQKEIVTVLRNTSIGVVCLGNIHSDESRQISSAFIERLVTDPEPMLQTARSADLGLAREADFVVCCSVNSGKFSVDLMNRSCPIEVELTGDLENRPMPLGNLRQEWLPAHREELEAEMLGMIQNWIDAGSPLDTDQHHPMTVWAQTIGGILKVNGFEGFLGNWTTQKAVANPVEQRLGWLVYIALKKRQQEREGGEKNRFRVMELVEIAREIGTLDELLPGGSKSKVLEKEMGMLLTNHVGSTVRYDLSDEDGISDEDAQNPLREYTISRHRGRVNGTTCTYYEFDEKPSSQENIAA